MKTALRIASPLAAYILFCAVVWLIIRPRVETALVEARASAVQDAARHTVRNAESWMASRIAIVSAAAAQISAQPRVGEELVSTLIRQHTSLRMIRIYASHSDDELIGRGPQGTNDSLTFEESRWKEWSVQRGTHVLVLSLPGDSMLFATRVAFTIGESQFFCSALWNGEALTQILAQAPVPDGSLVHLNGTNGLVWKNWDASAVGMEDRVKRSTRFEHMTGELTVAFPTASIVEPARNGFLESLGFLALLMIPSAIARMIRWRRESSSAG